MDLFNYDNFTGIHAIEAYWNQGNMFFSLLLCAFYFFVFAFSFLILVFMLICLYHIYKK